MKARHFNVAVLLILIAAVSVFASQRTKKDTTAQKPTGETERRSLPPNSVSDEVPGGAIIAEKRLPMLADGPIHTDHLEIRARCSINVGEDVYTLDHSEIFRNGQLYLTHDFSWPTGLAYDSKRNRLVVSTSHVESFLHSYDLTTNEWLEPILLNGAQPTRLVYSTAMDTLLALDVDHGEDRIQGVYLLNPVDGSFEHKKFDFPIIGVPADLSWNENSLVVGALYEVNPQTGKISATLRGPYKGADTALVSVYEASSDHDRMARFTVDVRPSAPPNLVLTAYEGVEWQIQGGENLERIVVSGYDPCKVTGAPSGCAIEISYYGQGETLPEPYQLQSAEMAVLLETLEVRGLGVSRIAAAYQAQEAIIK